MKLKTGHYLIGGIAIIGIIALAKGKSKGCCNGGNKGEEPIIPEPQGNTMQQNEYVGAGLTEGWLAGRTLLVPAGYRFPGAYSTYTPASAWAGREMIPDQQGRKIVNNFCCT